MMIPFVENKNDFTQIITQNDEGYESQFNHNRQFFPSFE